MKGFCVCSLLHLLILSLGSSQAFLTVAQTAPTKDRLQTTLQHKKVSSTKQDASIQQFIFASSTADGWSVFWWTAGLWNIAIASTMFFRPDLLNISTVLDDKQPPPPPPLDTVASVAMFGFIYISYAFDNIPKPFWILPLAAGLKLSVTPLLYNMGCLGRIRTIHGANGEETTKENKHVVKWRIIAAGDAIFALIFLFYFASFVKVPNMWSFLGG